MPLVTRRALAQDHPALQRIFLAGRRQIHIPGILTLDQFDEQTAGELVLVSEDAAATPLGFISIHVESRFIHHLYVAAGQQRRGVGIALLRALPGWPDVRYRLKCLSLNTAALAFYASCDFLPIGSGSSGSGDYLLLELRAPGIPYDSHRCA
ncbi:MAG: GNAT family N-acetyltransferase [Janthinobacterium lividum]